MSGDHDDHNSTDGSVQGGDVHIEKLLRTAAYEAWLQRREEWQDCSITLFDRAYLGQYSHIDHYVETMVDSYELDAKLDATIIEPFREFIDVDITGLGRSLVRHGTLYAIPAAPVGVWVFNGEIG